MKTFFQGLTFPESGRQGASKKGS